MDFRLFFLPSSPPDFDCIWSTSAVPDTTGIPNPSHTILPKYEHQSEVQAFGDSMWAIPQPPWAAHPPQGEVRQETNPPSIAASLIGFGAFSTIVALIVVLLRVYVRSSSARGLKADDYFIVLAMMYLFGFFVICVRLTVYGVGTHVWDVFLADYSPGILQLIFLAQLVGCLMVSFSKLSILALYTSITPNKKFRAGVYTLMSIVVAFTVAYILVQILDCKPVAAQWDLKLVMASHGHSCIDSDVSPMLVLSIVNILVDVAVVLLPIPVILPLQIPKSDKISCLLLFAAGGGLVSIAAIGRTVELIPLLEPRSTKFVDVTWLVVPELNWAFAEGSVAIVAASLPAIRPLFKHLLSKKARDGSGGDTNPSGMALHDLSNRSRDTRARQSIQWPHSNTSTLDGEQRDEELGLCPGSSGSTQGTDQVSPTPEDPISGSCAPGGHLRGAAEPCRRVDVSTADVGVAH